MLPDFSALASLLGPELSPERFIEEYFDQRPVMLHHGKPGRPDDCSPFGGLLRLEEMDELLFRALQPQSPVELLIFQDLAFISSYATPHIAFASGASLILNRVDKLWPSVHDLCCGLARSTRYAYANLYLTPHDSQTAPPHTDDHDVSSLHPDTEDIRTNAPGCEIRMPPYVTVPLLPPACACACGQVFILQLHGRKHWRVWPAGHPCGQSRPFTDEQAGKDPAKPKLKPDELGPPEIEGVLEAGDVLYIPRGVLHVANTVDSEEAECSLHLTVAVPTWDLSYSGALLHAISSECFHGRAFRRSLPLGPLPLTSAPVAIASARAPMTALSAPPSAPAPWSVSLSIVARSASAVQVQLDVARRSLADSAAAAGEATLGGVGGGSMAGSVRCLPGRRLGTRSMDARDEWRQAHAELWAAVHSAVSVKTVVEEMDWHMARQRAKQQAAFARFSAHAAATADADAASGTMPLCSESKLLKLVPLELFTPEEDWPVNDLRRVAQAAPLPGGAGRLAYIHAPAELFPALEAFATWPVGTAFRLDELPARHCFLRACAARSLFGLGVLSLLPETSTVPRRDIAARAPFDLERPM